MKENEFFKRYSRFLLAVFLCYFFLTYFILVGSSVFQKRFLSGSGWWLLPRCYCLWKWGWAWILLLFVVSVFASLYNRPEGKRLLLQLRFSKGAKRILPEIVKGLWKTYKILLKYQMSDLLQLFLCNRCP